MYDLTSEWDQYMLRYGGYTVHTLEEFVAEGTATYDAATDSYTITSTSSDGKVDTWTVHNSVAPLPGPSDGPGDTAAPSPAEAAGTATR
jgi:hypothetical protein